MARIKPLQYGIAPNSLLNNKEITLKAKGLYTFMNCKPENWEFSYKGLQSQLQEQKTAIKTAIKELEKYGYLIRRKYKKDNGQWGWEYELTLADYPSIENPSMVYPSMENIVHISKKELSKKELSKKEKEYVFSQKKKPYFMGKIMSEDLKWVIWGKNDLRKFAGDKGDIVWK